MLRKLADIEINQPLVDSTKLLDYRLTNDELGILREQLGSIGYGFDKFTSFAVTDVASADKPANYALIPNQYFVFASELYEFATELFKYFELFEKLRSDSVSLLGRHDEIQRNIEANPELYKHFESAADLELFARFLDKDNSSYRLGSKRLVNDQGKPRGSRDCFGSVVLKEINLPDASSSIFGRLVYDLCKNPETYSRIKGVYQTLQIKEIHAVKTELEVGTYLSKPFLLLAGISGTGKTRFVREQAKTSLQFDETYCLTSVRPDWHEPSDLLGYVSRLSNEGRAEYVTTDVLKFIARAWRAIVSAGLDIKVNEADGEGGRRLVVSGQREQLERVLPYWLCLDEMNLAPVEQYFADYLSVLETREWCWDDDAFTYASDALLKAAVIEALDDQDRLREALGFGGDEAEAYDELWGYICKFGLGIPFNLMVAGTVNMDETTHGFSRKVIDRALSFDFGAFFPNDYSEFFSPSTANKRLSYPTISQASKADLVHTADPEGQNTVAFLTAVNGVLKNTPFELAFRALNELLIAVASSQPQDDLTLKAVWDDFMMCKVLPRIEGDTDKLTVVDANGQGKALLAELNRVLAEQLAPIWQPEQATGAKQRPDLYREKVAEEGEEKVVRIPCRSKAKIKWMSDRLESATFTSFWP